MSHKFFRLITSLFLALALTAVASGAQPARAAGPWYVATTGDDNNDCLSPGTPCGTINGALAKPGFIPGDTARVALGIYTGTGSEVVFINKEATLSGGWDTSFASQSGMSTIDGLGASRGLRVNSGIIGTIDHFIVQNGVATSSNSPYGCMGNGIYNAGTLNVQTSVVRDNNTTGYGGGICNDGVITINNSTISSNSANEGGGIFNSGTVTVNNSTISSNSTFFGYGGGIYSFGPLTINNSAISNNSSYYDGGGIRNFDALTLNNSTVSDNTAGDLGAGIHSDNSGTIILNNSTVSRNSTTGRYGGGIFGGNLSAHNSTISENMASLSGGGIASNLGVVTLQNTILAGNTAPNSPDCNGTFGSSGYNIIGDISNCDFVAVTGDLINTDPLLGPLQDNGGPTFTHALLALSLAIDAGDPAGCADQDGNPLTTDQRGFNRTEGTGCDIGAYEADITAGPATSLAVLSGNGQLSSPNTAFSEPLRAVALDGQGNRVSGVNITFTAPANGPSGTFADTGTNTTSVNTDAGGAATTSVFTANDQPGAYSISATAPGLSSVDFNLEQIVPSADNFAEAGAIISLPFRSTTDITDATIEPGEPQFCGIERTVWYSFTPIENITVRADTLGGTVAGMVNVYSSGSGISDLNFLGCSNTHGSVNFNAEAGKTYYLQIGSANFWEVGNIQINLEQIFPPANDHFSDAEVVSSLPFTATVDISDATNEPSEPQSCLGMDRTVWYSFTPTEDQSVRVTTEGSAVSGNVNIYRATGPEIFYLQFLSSSLCSNSQPFIAEAGQTYYLQVGFASSEVGSVQINLENVLPPANNDFASAISIDTFPSTTDFTNIGARMESGEPGLSCDYGSPSAQSTIWFSYTATQDETISASIFNSTFPPIWAVYSGTSLNELTELGCRYYDNLSWRAIAGQTYYIQISGLYGSSGTGTLSLEPASPPQAYFYFDPFDPSTSETIQFYDYSYDPAGIGIETWEWDFGDGTPPSTAQYPIHMYAADGDYSVTLTVTTFDGRSASVTQVVQVRTQFTYTIDIKPGSQTNPINPRSSGKTPVAILSTPDFNAPLDVDRTSLTFGRTGDELSLVSCNRRGEDVNGDGLKDLVCHFKTKLTGFNFGDTEGILRGLTLGGVSIEAHDVVRVLHASYP